jgi:hypothetical protein
VTNKKAGVDAPARRRRAKVSFAIYTPAVRVRQAIQSAIGDILAGSTLTGAEVEAVLYVFRNSSLPDRIETIIADNNNEVAQDVLRELDD